MRKIVIRSPLSLHLMHRAASVTRVLTPVAPRARHLASVGEGMIIEHQIDDHH